MLLRHISRHNLQDPNWMLRFFQEAQKILNGGIEWGPAPVKVDTPIYTPNLNGALYTTTSPGVANTEFAVKHNLNRVPIGWDVKRINKAASVYDSGTAWTKTHIYLKCSVVTVNLTLFIH